MKVAIIYNEDSTNVINTFGMQNKEKYNPGTVKAVAESLENGGHNVSVIDGNMHVIETLQEFMPKVLEGEKMGMVFNMAYGIQGESRYTHIPSMLEMLGIPYVGSSPAGHALALDKVITKGRGFAVVASEVRKLAESSGAAAKDITEITQNSVHRAIAAQEKIEQIVPAMIKTADLVEEITMASQEQNKGAEQINQSIVQLDTVIQQNASSSEELAAMSEELLSQATSMKDTISFFDVEGLNRTLKYLPEATIENQVNLKKPESKPVPVIQTSDAEFMQMNTDEKDFEEF